MLFYVFQCKAKGFGKINIHNDQHKNVAAKKYEINSIKSNYLLYKWGGLHGHKQGNVANCD